MSHGGAIVGKSWMSFSVNDNLVAKVAEAVKLGDADARKRGKIRSFEVFVHGNRQNLVVGTVMVIPPQVADSLEDFPVALLYGAMCSELSPEANADLLTYKLGESEYDEYKDSDLSAIKDRLFKDAQGKFRSIILFIPSWSNPKNYVIFKMVKDEALLSMFIRHQIFAAYYDPALSSSFNQMMTEVDTSKFDITDITPKLNYPFLAENPFKQYPQLRDDDKVDVKMASGASYSNTPKVFFGKTAAADAFVDDLLEPGEKKTLNQLSKDLKKGIEGELTDPEDLKTGADNEGLQMRPDYDSPESHSADMNGKNAAKTAYELTPGEKKTEAEFEARRRERNSSPEILAQIKDYARKNYNKGWDIVVEAMDDHEIEEYIVDGGNTLQGAIKSLGRLVQLQQEQELNRAYDGPAPKNASRKKAADRIQTFPAWKRKVLMTFPKAVFEGDIDIAQAFTDATKEVGVGEWDGSYGEVYVDRKDPKVVEGLQDFTKKAESVAQDVSPDTSSVGQDVDKEIPSAPAIAEVALETVLASKTAGADTKYGWNVSEVGRDSWGWNITKKGLTGTKSVAKGTASSKAEAEADCKKKLNELQGRKEDPTGKDPRFAKKKEASFEGIKASEMDNWVAAGLGIAPGQGKLKDPVKKIAKTAAAAGETLLSVDGCTLEKVTNPRRDTSSNIFPQHIYKATGPGGIEDSPAFDGHRIYWDKPEDFPPSFRMAVEKYFKNLAKQAKRHTAEVLTDVDDILKDITEELGPAPMIDIKDKPSESSDNKETKPKAEAEAPKTDPEPTPSAPKKETNPGGKLDKLQERRGEGKYEESTKKGLKDGAEEGKKEDASVASDKKEDAEKKTASKFMCDYCGSKTNNVTRICNNCEQDMECELCGKKFVDTPEDSGYTEIRPDIFAHESCIKFKTAAFNMYVPGQVLEEFYPEVLHDTVEYPNDSNSPMIDNSVLDAGPGYIPTSPAAGMGIGNNGKPEVLEGAPLKQETDIRGPQFDNEFYQQYEGLSGGSLRAASVVKTINKKAGKEENKAQFIDFLKKVMGEVAATFLAAFKVTTRGILTDVPGVGEIQLANVEQPSNVAFNQINTGSRVQWLLEKMNDTDIQEALNEAWAQSSVYNDSPNGGFVYEVFVRGQSIDVDSMILKYEYVCGSKGL